VSGRKHVKLGILDLGKGGGNKGERRCGAARIDRGRKQEMEVGVDSEVELP
jgi:hypothetical protein